MEDHSVLLENPLDIAAWAEKLEPAFVGRTAKGKFICLYTWECPFTGDFNWGLGWANSAIDARDIAIREIVNARFGVQFGLAMENAT